MESDDQYSGVFDPAPDAEWELWYEDVFDKECPRQVEAVGRGLLAGLAELWARHLFETVRVDGQRGFSRFNLWWKQQGKSVEVVGEWDAMIRLRKWIFGNKRQAYKSHVEESDKELLMTVARAHGCLLLDGQTSERIFTLVESCMNRENFEGQVVSLYPGASEINE